MTEYDPKVIEAKWRSLWAEHAVFRVADADPAKSRFYALEMLPYPSGRIHMGHVRNYSIGDAVARFRRMRGEQVLHVIGWDAFGLPAENAAIQNNEEPRAWTLRNIATMRAQLQRLGIGYDWDREIATCLPEYYRWNQWMFLRMLERGIAFRARRNPNWCPSCATVLANEQVVASRCWRCDNPVVRREFDQWFLKITDYAQELLDGLDDLPAWPERVRTMQRNWLGRSAGARVFFAVDGASVSIEVFTTRIDTIFGATYVALAVEHPRLMELVAGTEHEGSVGAFIAAQTSRSVEDRFADAAEKLGVFTGRHAINPFTGEKIPIWTANFVLTDVGTGAIMGVPAHDERDFEFARKYGLNIRRVIDPAPGADPAVSPDAAFTEDGIVRGSLIYDGLDSETARAKMSEDAEASGFGSKAVTFRLKDWGISRQRYWGTPIPVIHCAACGIVPVPDADLPVLLPDHAPLTGEGGSPLARVPAFLETTCPRCGGPAQRETDTMDTFVDSCWYYFRYCDPQNDQVPFDWSKASPWFPVGLYIGGIEHATMHLIYTRFWTKVMRDLGLVELDEPVSSLFTQGMVVKDGAKMSKSKGNVVDPDQMVERYGADTTRLFSLFAAPPERDLEWSEAGVEGCFRFLGRLWRTFEKARSALPPARTPPPPTAGDALALRRKTHQTLRRVTEDLGPRMHLNTPVAAVMELLNETTPLVQKPSMSDGESWAVREAFETVARILSPFAPHIAEELWEGLGFPPFVATTAWPTADAALLVQDEVLLVVQVNGKVRGKLVVKAGISEAEAIAAARADAKVSGYLGGRTIGKTVYVPDRLLNVVVG